MDAEFVRAPLRTAPARRRRARRVAVWVPAALALLAITALATRAHGGNARTARASAAHELRWTLEPGEIVVAEVAAAQRYWWNYFSETHGVLAVTDRRIIFVGAEPPSLTAPKDWLPTFETREFPHGRPLTLAGGPVFLGSASGIIMGTPGGREIFALDAERGDRVRVRAVIRAIEDARTTHRRELELEELANISAPPPPPIYEEHRVLRGQTLSSIAVRYHLTTDELRQLNDLLGDGIQAGQRLLVPVLP